MRAFIGGIFLFHFSVFAQGVSVTQSGNEITIGNPFLSRSFGFPRERMWMEPIPRSEGRISAKRGNTGIRRGGCGPTTIDDGWQNTSSFWKTNSKFDADFATSKKDVQAVGSNGGQGSETIQDYMCIAGPTYMIGLENRLVELTNQGVRGKVGFFFSAMGGYFRSAFFKHGPPRLLSFFH